MTTESNVDAAIRMDTIYRLQRHFYDATRKFYLLGRDRLLHRLPALAAPDILEIGCGTGRNLVKLARRYPMARLSGVDVSSEMLTTARAAVDRAGMSRRIALQQVGGGPEGIASPERLESADIVLCSYVLSMVPHWSLIVAQAMRCLKPGGVLAVVDFKDQHTAPAWRRVILLKWLSLFHVFPRAEIEAGLRALAAREGGLALDEDVGGGYAYLFMLKKAAGAQPAAQ